MDKHITILIRTSNRPKSFRRCIKSILHQKYPHINLLVSADNAATKNYVEDLNILPVEVRKNTSAKAPYNLYLNDLLSRVEQGWLLILDDDDTLAPDAIKTLIDNKAFDDTSALVLTTMIWPDGRTIPEAEYLGKPPVRKHIGMPCFMVHTSNKHLLKFDGNKAADYRMAVKLYPRFSKKVLISKPIVHVGNTGNNGKPIDI